MWLQILLFSIYLFIHLFALHLRIPETNHDTCTGH